MIQRTASCSRMWSGVLLGLATALLLAPLAAAAPAGQLVVDDFSTTQPPLIATLGSPASLAVSGGGILGVERDVQTTVTSGSPGQVTCFVSSQTLVHDQDAGIVARTRIQWDGADGSQTLDPTGLGGVDLTQGGLQDRLEVEVLVADLPVDLTITVYSGADASRRTVSFPGGQGGGGGATYYYFVYSSFTKLAGAGADFQDVGAVELLIDGKTAGANVAIGGIQTVSPTSIGLASLSATAGMPWAAILILPAGLILFAAARAVHRRGR